MPLITIEMYAGRDIETKKKLIKDVTEVVAKDVNCPKEAVIILIRDMPKENWAIGGEVSG
jgi:4-oxalocrotonate tautomerase